MNKNLEIALLQSNLAWENPEANRLHFEKTIGALSNAVDLIVLPEMFTTGFSMNPESVAEDFSSGSKTVVWMQKMAESSGAVICGSISARDGSFHYNRLIWMRPDGSFDFYDKCHLFSFAGEDQHYTRGLVRKVFEINGWRICPLICYDLRFPVWSRNKLSEGRPDYDLLVYVANWPAVRRDPWQKLLYARAIENLTFLAAVNRTGIDANGHEYAGDSMIIGPRGELLADASAYTESVIRSSLDKTALDDFREKFPALRDGAWVD